MKTIHSKQVRFGALALVIAAGSVLVPVTASANTAANTTIRNTVYVDYADGAAVAQPQVFDEVDVTVQLVAATPSLHIPSDPATDPADQTIAPSSTATYSYAVHSNANGPDTYNLTTSIAAFVNLTAPGASASLSTASVALGATTVAVAPGLIAANTPTAITVPADTNGADDIVNGIDELDVVVINGVRCDVTAVVDGSVPGTGAITNASITVDCDVAVTPTVGMVIGEQVSFTVTVDPTALTAGNTTGNVTVTTSARDTANVAAADTDDTITYIEQLIAVIKYVRNVTTGAAGTGTSITVATNTYYPSGIVGTPGQVLEYLIAVQNTSASSTATDVVISDPVPAFTTFDATGFAVINNAQTVTTATSTANDGDAGEVVAGTVYLYPGSTTHGDDTDGGTGNANGDGGSVAAGLFAYGRFRVTIN